MDRVDYESLIIQDLITFHTQRSLNISPWYQRRSVWSTPQKAYLINTIFEQMPVPSLYIRHQIDLDNERSIKEVVDGQQRIRTILSYRDDEFAARHPSHRAKVRYSELTRDEKHRFLATALSVGYLIGADDSDVIEIFGRINSISKTLNAQEKRNASFSGEFKQFCLRQAATRLPFWRATQIFSSNEISRMAEVQFISDLTLNMIAGLRDYSSKAIDDAYRQYDAEFAMEEDLSARYERLFEKLVALPSTDFSDTIFKSTEIALSLMVALDRLRNENITVGRIHVAIEELDSRIQSYAEREVLTADEINERSGFTGGNLHRIRARQIRDQSIEAALR